jgi:biopolymer transport protein ExbB
MKRLAILLALASPAASAFGQPAATASESSQLWTLFWGSRDLFTLVLLAGSLAGVSLIFYNLLEIRESRFLPRSVTGRCRDLDGARRWDSLAEVVRDKDDFYSRVVNAGLSRLAVDTTAIRDAAELAASEEAARWFRRVEWLNTIGNLGPLVGLAGTVWGMILAFTSLGDRGGVAGPADLSLGISKALFHTLLGLCLAVPCLFAFTMLRGKVDRLCTRAASEASDIIDLLPGNSISLHRVSRPDAPAP